MPKGQPEEEDEDGKRVHSEADPDRGQSEQKMLEDGGEVRKGRQGKIQSNTLFRTCNRPQHSKKKLDETFKKGLNRGGPEKEQEF